MESMSALPSDPATDLAAAEAARERLVGSLRMPAWFYTSLGAATAVQVGGASYGLSDDAGGPRLVFALAGAVVFIAVAAVLMVRFRRLNHVRVHGLFNRALMGTTTLSSLAYTLGLGAAVWAGLEGQWVLAVLASVAGGAGYAGSAWLWWRDYRRDPVAHGRGMSWWTTALVIAAATAFLVVLVAAS